MSKPKFLTRILISGLRPGQLVMQVLGLLFSFMLLAIATQGTLDYQSISDASKEGIGEDIIVLSKRSKQPSFEKAELDSLKSLVSVLEVYPFKSNQVDMEMGFEGLGKAARSDYFGFECIDSDVLATEQWDWDWSFSTDSLAEVPILIPKDFLRLSSVLTSDNIPLSENELKYFRLELMPKDSLNNPTNASFKARVVGSSDRISAVVVPCGFVDYLNSTFVRKKSLKLKPKRIAVKFDVERVIELKEYINAQGYETNESKLRSGEHAALFRGAFIAVGMLGLFVLLLSLTGVLLTVQLMITRSKEQIESVLIQGIHPRTVLGWYIKGLTILFVFLSIMAFIAVYMLKKIYVIPFLDKFSFVVSTSMISWETLAFIGIVVAGMLLVNATMIFLELRRMFTR